MFILRLVYKEEIVVNDLFHSLPTNYQENMVINMIRSGFIFDRVDCLYYSCNKESVNRGGTIIKSPD